MSRTVPTLVFLHGIQREDATESEGWREALQSGWAAQSLPWNLDMVPTREPRYNDLFVVSANEDVDPPPPTRRAADARSARVAFEVRRQSLRLLVGDDGPAHERRSSLGFIPNPMIDGTVGVGRPHQVLGIPERYRTSPGMRHRVLHRLLESLDGLSEVVIVAHSLGSVVALDLLGRLPSGLEVTRLVTIGSPLGREATVAKQWDLGMRRSTFPYDRLGSWLNVWSPGDVVCGGRPVDHPAVVNVRAEVRAHAHRYYLAQPVVGLAVGEALFGSPGRAVVPSAGAVDRDYAPGEAQLLRLIQAGRVMRDVIESGKDRARAQRFGAALSIREQRFFEVYSGACEAQGRAPHPALAKVIGDPQHVPDERAERQPDAWVDQLVMLLHFDFTEPSEISTRDHHEDFAGWMARRFAVGRSDGVVVFKATDDTRDALRPRQWGRYLAVAAGVAMLAAATGGIGLAAAPGLAGAAAVTSGLAAFGPGGMIGGLMTAGGLASAGSASLVASMLSSGGATAEETILQLTSQALARKRLGKPIVDSPEPVVLELRAAIAERLETNRALSDKGSSGIKRDEDLLDFCDRALAFIENHNLRSSAE